MIYLPAVAAFLVAALTLLAALIPTDTTREN